MGRPKALVPWGPRTFLEHLLHRAARAGLSPRLVVWGATPLGPGTCRGDLTDVTWVHHPRWAEGPFSSLRAGLAAVPAGSHAMVLTVDRPHVRPETLRALLQAAERQPRAVLQPSLEGRRGHPVLLPPDVVAQVLAWPPEGTLRDVLRAPDLAGPRRTVPTDDPAVLDNVDRPEDLARLPDP